MPQRTAVRSGALVSIVVVAVIMLTTYATAGWITVGSVPAMAAAMALLVRPLHHRQQAQREQQAQLATRASDIVAGLRVLRGIGGEDLFADRYATGSQDVMRARVRIGAIDSLLAGLEILLPGLLVALIVWTGARNAINDAVAIAHRLQTGRDADRVAVVEDGRIRELGSHDDLVAAGGAYADLWRSWRGRAQAVGEAAP